MKPPLELKRQVLSSVLYDIYDKEGTIIAQSILKEDAQYIVKACNNHERLVELVKDFHFRANMYPDRSLHHKAEELLKSLEES